MQAGVHYSNMEAGDTLNTAKAAEAEAISMAKAAFVEVIEVIEKTTICFWHEKRCKKKFNCSSL